MLSHKLCTFQRHHTTNDILNSLKSCPGFHDKRNVDNKEVNLTYFSRSLKSWAEESNLNSMTSSKFG